MRPSCCFWVAGLAILFTSHGCDNVLHPPFGDSSGVWTRTEDVEANFHLSGPDGTPRVKFKPDEELTFNYQIHNISDSPQPYSLPHLGPFVRFEVRHKSVSMGISDDAFGYPTVMVFDTLRADSTLEHEYAWRSSPLHGNLPQGEYSATATLYLTLDSTQTPVPLSLAFEVGCAPQAADCETANSVIITDTPADSIWLDTFDLNAACVDGDLLTLDISYSGGCQRHDFALFMTPAAFMESNPVRANLILRHDAHNDACEAYLAREIEFDLRTIAELHRQFYGPPGEIALHIKNHPDGRNGTGQTVSYLPD